MATGFMADKMGLDPNPTWGKARIIVTTGGAILILSSLLYDRYIGAWAKILRSRLINRFPSIFGKNASDEKRDDRLRGVYLFVASFLVVLIVSLIYTWVITTGTWNKWVPYTYYYADLATSFQHGHLYLETMPSPELLALSDPYDPAMRTDIEVFIDASLYKGRYYLYWGPVPALLLLLSNWILSGVNADLYLLYAFMIGALIFKTALLLLIFRRFFKQLPVWLFALGLLITGIVGHYAWTLNRPRVYETATTGGGFFFIAGFYFAYRALESNFSYKNLTLAGFMWACALGTRMIQLLPIASVIMMIITRDLTRQGNIPAWDKIAKSILGLGLPIAFALSGIAWYNFARFESIFEFGLYYQLLGGVDLQSFYDSIFSMQFVPQNIYNYLFAPFRQIKRFPFIVPELGLKEAIFSFQTVPPQYTTERITGLFRSSPILASVFCPLIVLFGNKLKIRGRVAKVHQTEDESIFRWLILSLTASSVLGFIPVAMYYWAANRFVADFMSPLSVLAIIGMWIFYSNLSTNGYLKPWIVLGIVALSLFSIMINLFLLSDVQRISVQNPELYNQLKGLVLTLPELFSK